MSRTKTGLGSLTVLVTMVAILLVSAFPMGQRQAAAEWSAPRTVYFSQTGHSLDQAFLDYWRFNNGAANYGYPITAEITQSNGHVVQYLQYGRFEWWPEGDANGNQFQLAKIGEELRPATLQRSLLATTGDTGSTVNTLTRAWLPVSAESDLAKDPERTYVAETGHTIMGGFRDFWTATGEDAYLGNPLSEEYTVDGANYQTFEYGQLKWTKDDGVTLVPVGELLTKKYGLDTSATAQGDVPEYDEMLFIEPTPEPTQAVVEQATNETTTSYAVDSGEVWVDVNLSYEYMTIYQGNSVLLETYISSGRPGFDTPTGTFYVNTMLPAQTMEGVIGGEYYNVPDVPYVMYFTGEGHAIHGTYWHSNFGTPMSHGCINMPMDAAAYLYSIAYIGMRVEIHF